MINLNSSIGNGLANGGDRLILKRPDGVVVDEMNWQGDTGVWNPGAVDVAEGNVLARMPSGYDTDQPSDWQELLLPSVDLIYPDEAGSYIWYWGDSHTIEWSATNNNGPDSDLDISIFFVKDVNQDTVISPGDTVHTIVETTDNDGAFTWTVPSGFIGYIWIHLIATGPENPMLNSGTISGRIYDPYPLYIGPANIIPPELPVEEEQEILTIETPVATSTEETIITNEEISAEQELTTGNFTTPSSGGAGQPTTDSQQPTTEEEEEVVVDGVVSEETLVEVIVVEPIEEELTTNDQQPTTGEEVTSEPISEIISEPEPVIIPEEPPIVIETPPASAPAPEPAPAEPAPEPAPASEAPPAE